MNNPYNVIGVSLNSTMEEITIEFNRRKSELMNLVLAEGDIGTKAACALQELKEAYQELEYIKTSDASLNDNEVNRPLGRIEEYIKQGELIDAQKLLDAQLKRGAEWHYIQAALYYKQGFLMESKKQLELAKQLEPQEEKYSKAYKGLINVVNFGHPEGPQIDGIGPDRSYPNPSDLENSSSCCSICGAIMCMDCCCEKDDKI